MKKLLYFSAAAIVALCLSSCGGSKNDPTPAPAHDPDGSEAYPWILKTANDLVGMANLLAEDKMVYFKLDADIDMDGVGEWTPLNADTPYNKGVTLDGNGHTIDNFKCEGYIYPSFCGVLNGTVKNITFDHATIKSLEGKAGVVAGYLGTNVGTTEEPAYVTGNVINVTVKNSTVSGVTYAGGIAGQVNSPAEISGCLVKDVTITSEGERVGGLIGQLGQSTVEVGASVKDCTAENVTASALKNIGALIGVAYCPVSNCKSSGSLTATAANSKEVSIGGLIGHIENTTVKDCSSSATVELTLQGRSIGGFAGTFKGGKIEHCYATGNVIGTYRNNGGFVGLYQTTAVQGIIENCYCTGNVTSQSYIGGFVGLVDATNFDAVIKNCYASGDVVGSSFDVGGFVGHDGNSHLQVINCAAWAKTVTAGAYAAGNWSSGAFAAVTFPTATFTNNYRNPAMELTAYWVPAKDYSHPDVSPTTPLIKQDGNASEATSLANGQDGYPIFPYHGHVAADKTLSQLAQETLGWSSEVWDFSAELPVFKKK